jgi:gliding motility-associated-like protein
VDQVVCNGADVSVLFSTQNTLGSTSYSWVSDIEIGAGLSGNDNMNFTATNSSTEPILATITVTPKFENDGKVCVGEAKTFTIVVNPNAEMNDVEDQVVCHGVSTESIIFSTNNLNGVMTYTWTNDTPSIGLSSSGIGDILAFTATNTTSVPITANITVTPTFGFDNVVCDGEQKIFTITVNPTAQVEQPQDQTVCNGDNVTVEFFTNNAVGNISYTWFADIDIGLGLTGEGDLNFTAINQTTSPIISNISVVSTFEDGLNNCTGAVKNFVIKVNPTAQVNTIQDVFICEGEISSVIDFTTINSNGVVSYTWINDNTDIGLVTNGVGSIESFVAENPTNEIITANLTVTPSYSNDGVLCLGPSENFLISVSPKPEMNEVITNVNCSYSEPLCVASIEISPDGIGPFIYNWVSLDGNVITNPSNQDQFDLCPGSYRVTVTDGSNCSYSYEYQVNPPEPIEFILVTLTNLSCNNIGSEFCDGSIEVSTDGGSYPYALQEWYTESIPGSGDFDLGPLVNINNPNQLINACQGNYVYKVLDANGCEFISPVYTIDAAPGQVNISETISNYNGYNIDCFSSNSGSLEIEVSGGSGIFDFSLTNDQTGQIVDSSQNQIGPLNLVFDFLTAGDYTLILIDSNCSSEIIRNYSLTQPDELQIIATLVSPPSCFSGLATYDVSATGGVPPYTGTGLQSVLSGPASFTVLDSNGCSDDYSTIINEPEELSAEYSTEDALCFGDNGLITINPDGGTGIITVNIYDENFLFIESLNTSQGTPISFFQPDGTYFFDFSDANDCYFGPQLVVINEPEPIVVDVEIIQPNCNTIPEWSFNNGSICISITGGSNPVPIGVNWIDSGNGNWCLTDLTDGIYPVVVVDENGCEPINEIQNVVLTSPPPITVDFNSSIDIDCDTNTITQTNFIFIDGGQPPYEITWSGGIFDPLNSNIMETSVEGNYSAFVNDQLGILNGCPPLEFPLDPIAFFEFGLADFTMSSANSDFCDVFAVSDPISFINISTGDITSFSWDFGDGSPLLNGVDSPVHVYDALGTYTISLTVEDLYGCFDTYSQTIDITKGYEIILPNAFTPNGDGINETIRPVSNCMTKIKMSIYDTWGSLIYVELAENQDIYGWDGTIDGNPAENGNYIMVVEATTFNGAVIDLNGPVTLIK